VLVLGLAASAYGLETKAVQMREDFGSQPLYDCYMNYYYYIPCTTNSWFWIFSGWSPGDIVGEWFTIGDPSMGRTGAGCPPYIKCDPCGLASKSIERLRVLDFAGYGTTYPGLFTVRFDIWCSDENGCPAGPRLLSSGPKEFCAAGWNYIDVWPPTDVILCYTELVGNAKCSPRFLITATHTGTQANYPAWGVDNICTPVGLACAMHDNGCCPALYPRPAVSHYTTMHSGYYGVNFANCPPSWFMDPGDTVGNVYGYSELAWRVYTFMHVGTEPSTWGTIKSMYK
jgi:hypothetical protein